MLQLELHAAALITHKEQNSFDLFILSENFPRSSTNVTPPPTPPQLRYDEKPK